MKPPLPLLFAPRPRLWVTDISSSVVDEQEKTHKSNSLAVITVGRRSKPLSHRREMWDNMWRGSQHNNGIHHGRGSRHTCLPLTTMPRCLFISCQKSLCLLADTDSNLILFISFFYFFCKKDLKLWGKGWKEGEKGGEGGGKDWVEYFLLFSGCWLLFLPDSCLLRSQMRNNKDCHSPGAFH